MAPNIPKPSKSLDLGKIIKFGITEIWVLGLAALVWSLQDLIQSFFLEVILLLGWYGIKILIAWGLSAVLLSPLGAFVRPLFHSDFLSDN